MVRRPLLLRPREPREDPADHAHRDPGHGGHIFQVEVPMEDATEVKHGQKKIVRRVRVPGYVLVRMDLTDESWRVVRETPGVTGFVGNATNPTPLSFDEIYSLLAPSVGLPEKK